VVFHFLYDFETYVVFTLAKVSVIMAVTATITVVLALATLGGMMQIEMILSLSRRSR
jgi:hypothetical protein